MRKIIIILYIIGLVIVISIYGLFFVRYSSFLVFQRSIQAPRFSFFCEPIQAPRRPFGEIIPTNNLMQTIKISDEQTIHKIEILLATYARINSNNTSIEVFKDGFNYYSATINSAKIKDNSYFEISGVEIPVKPNDLLEIIIYSDDGEPGNAITAWINNNHETNNLRSYNKLTNTFIKMDGEMEYILYSKSIPISQYLSTRFIALPHKLLFIFGLTIVVLIDILFFSMISLSSENYETNHPDPML